MSNLERGLHGLAELYADLDRELAALKPRCELSGRCCNFKESGLTLFATDLEIEWLRRKTPPPDANGAASDPDLCPWWKGGLCQARDGRPLGCRVYFCDTSKAAELEEISTRYHARLKRLYEESAESGESEGCEPLAYHYAPFVRRVRKLLAR